MHTARGIHKHGEKDDGRTEKGKKSVPVAVRYGEEERIGGRGGEKIGKYPISRKRGDHQGT